MILHIAFSPQFFLFLLIHIDLLNGCVWEVKFPDCITEIKHDHQTKEANRNETSKRLEESPLDIKAH